MVLVRQFRIGQNLRFCYRFVNPDFVGTELIAPPDFVGTELIAPRLIQNPKDKIQNLKDKIYPDKNADFLSANRD
jgi:hypothetical protein